MFLRFRMSYEVSQESWDRDYDRPETQTWELKMESWVPMSPKGQTDIQTRQRLPLLELLSEPTKNEQSKYLKSHESQQLSLSSMFTKWGNQSGWQQNINIQVLQNWHNLSNVQLSSFSHLIDNVAQKHCIGFENKYFSSFIIVFTKSLQLFEWLNEFLSSDRVI